MDTRNLITSNGNKTGIVKCWLSNQKCEAIYKSFFEYMSSEGWSKYTTKDFLQKSILKYSNIFVKANKELGEDVYSEDDLKRLGDKFKGNILEILAEGYFRFISSQKLQVKFKSWCGQDSNDLGIDGYATDLSNDNFLIAIQAKYRTTKEIDWQDGIQKAYVLVSEEMKEKLRGGAITGEEYLRWLNIHPVILFTSTDAKWNMKEWAEKWLMIIDQEELYRTLGMYTENGNKTFWETLYNEFKK